MITQKVPGQARGGIFLYIYICITSTVHIYIYIHKHIIYIYNIYYIYIYIHIYIYYMYIYYNIKHTYILIYIYIYLKKEIEREREHENTHIDTFEKLTLNILGLLALTSPDSLSFKLCLKGNQGPNPTDSNGCAHVPSVWVGYFLGYSIYIDIDIYIYI